MFEINNDSAIAISEQIKKKRLSSEQLMLHTLEQIEHHNSRVNALVSQRDEDSCLAAARLADRELAQGRYRGWLHGMPFAIKDLFHAKEFPTTFGSPVFKEPAPKRDDPHVSNIKAAGAIIIGKTNVPEFGLGGHTSNSIFGVTRNGRFPDLSAGGSSGGAASVITSGILPIADGSDMMGSLRTPSAFQHIIGFRPTQGTVPACKSADPLKLKLSSIGPMGQSVADVTELFKTMRGFAGSTYLETELEPKHISRLRIGWLGDANGHWPIEQGLMEVCISGLERLMEQGALVEQCQPKYPIKDLWQPWLTLRQKALSSAQNTFINNKINRKLSTHLHWELEQSRQITDMDFRLAKEARTKWQSAYKHLFSNYDVIAAPGSQVFPFSCNHCDVKKIHNQEMDTYHRWLEITIPASLANAPVICLPVGPAILPNLTGIQIMMTSGEDFLLLKVAEILEPILKGGRLKL